MPVDSTVLAALIRILCAWIDTPIAFTAIASWTDALRGIGFEHPSRKLRITSEAIEVVSELTNDERLALNLIVPPNRLLNRFRLNRSRLNGACLA